MFLLVPAYPGCPGQTAVKWLLLLLLIIIQLSGTVSVSCQLYISVLQFYTSFVVVFFVLLCLKLI